MWKKESRLWKILERDEGELIKADARILINNSTVIEFVKRYQEPKRDLLRGGINYFGTRYRTGSYKGFWSGKNSGGKKTKGGFCLVDVKENWAVEELMKIIGKLHLRDFDLRVRDL